MPIDLIDFVGRKYFLGGKVRMLSQPRQLRSSHSVSLVELIQLVLALILQIWLFLGFGKKC